MKQSFLLASIFFIIILSFLPIQTDFTQDIHGYLWANYLQFNGQLSQSQHWYNKIIHANGSIYSYKGYFNLLYENGNYQKIVSLIKEIKNSLDNDPDIQLIFIRSLHKIGHKKKAEELLISLNNTFTTHAEIALETTRIYIERKDFTSALHTIDKILNSTCQQESMFGFYFLKAHIYAQLQEYEKAHANINKCIECNPHFDKGWLLQGIIKEEKENKQETMLEYRSYINTAHTLHKQIEHHLHERSLYHKTFYDYEEQAPIKQYIKNGAHHHEPPHPLFCSR